LTVHFAIRLGERRRGAAGAPPLPTRRCFGAVRESPQPRGLEYANFDCQEQVNAGQKVAQLGHAIGTKIIRGASNFFAANILRIALLERHQSEDFGMRTAIPLTVLAAALACSLASAPAHARARVFVASYGNDANPCTFASFKPSRGLSQRGKLGSVCTPFFSGECLWNCDRNDRNIQRNHRFLRCGRELPWGREIFKSIRQEQVQLFM